MKKKKEKKPLFTNDTMKQLNITLFFIFIVLFSSVYFITSSNSFVLTAPQHYNIGWSITENEETNTTTYRHDARNMMSNKSLSFLTNNCYIDAYLDDQLIYHFGKEPKFGTSPGTYQHMIELPVYVRNDQVISIDVHSPDENGFNYPMDFLIGSSTDITFYLINQHMGMYINSFIIMIFGVLLILICLLGINSERSISKIYLGLLMIDFSLWIISRSYLAELILKNSMAQYYISFYLLFLIPLLLINYMRTTLPMIKCILEHSTMALSIMACVLAHFSNFMSFSETSRHFNFITCVVITSLMIKVIVFQIKQKRIHTDYIALIIFMLAVTVHTLLYFLNVNNGENTSLIQYGFFAYIVLAIYAGIHDLIDVATRKQENETYYKYALTDSLTGIGNRAAFFMHLKSQNFRKLGYFSMDLMNLKYHNAMYGISTGDELLKAAATLLKEIFPSVYRVGSDEFIALTPGNNPGEMITLKKLLKKNMRHFNTSQSRLIIEIACGYAFYVEGDATYEDILRRAEIKMYTDKNRLRANSQIHSLPISN